MKLKIFFYISICICVFFIISCKDKAVITSNAKWMNPVITPTATEVPVKKWICVTQNAIFPGRYGHTTIVYDDKIWVIGGAGSSGYLNDVWYSSNGINWIKATGNAGFSPRVHHSNVVYDGRMWVIAGYPGTIWIPNWGPANNPVNDVWYSYNGADWYAATRNAEFEKRCGHISFVYDNKMWVLYGGADGGGSIFCCLTEDIWYSTNGINWEKQLNTTYKTTARMFFTGVLYKDYLWITSGFGGANGYNNNDVWQSDNLIDWNQITLNAAYENRWMQTSVIYKDNMLIIGGTYSTNTNNVDLNDIWLSKNGVDWIAATRNAEFSPRYGHSSVVFKGKVWVIGGRDANSVYNNDVWYSE